MPTKFFRDRCDAKECKAKIGSSEVRVDTREICLVCQSEGKGSPIRGSCKASAESDAWERCSDGVMGDPQGLAVATSRGVFGD